MEDLFRLFNSLALALLSLFAPIQPLIYCALCFVIIDFISGTAASYKRAKRDKCKWFFESHEAWRTIYKTGFIIIAISMMWALESCVLDFVQLNLTKLLTGFICSVEMWSFLENCSQHSDAPLFEWMRKYLHRRIEKQIENGN